MAFAVAVHDSFNLLLLHFVCFQHFLRLQARLIAKTLKDLDKIAEDAAESKKFDASIEETSGSLVEVGFCCQLWSNISHIFLFQGKNKRGDASIVAAGQHFNRDEVASSITLFFFFAMKNLAHFTYENECFA